MTKIVGNKTPRKTGGNLFFTTEKIENYAFSVVFTIFNLFHRRVNHEDFTEW